MTGFTDDVRAVPIAAALALFGCGGETAGHVPPGDAQDAGSSDLSDASVADSPVAVGLDAAASPDAPVVEGGAAPSGPVIYHAVPGRSLASPLPNGVGITYDGQELWILAATGRPQPYELVRFDPVTLATDRTFTLGSLFSTPGTEAYGLTWDGRSIWISVAGQTNALMTVDPTSGQLTRQLSSPSVLGPVDLDFDGTSVWLSDGTGDAFRIDPVGGGVKQQFAYGDRDNGNAFRSGELFVGMLFGGMAVYDPATGKPLGTVTHGDGSPFARSELGPSVFVGSQLVVLSSLGLTFFDTVKVP